jgi:hypothetical protein
VRTPARRRSARSRREGDDNGPAGKAVTRSGRARNPSCLGMRVAWGRGSLGMRPVGSNAKGAALACGGALARRNVATRCRAQRKSVDLGDFD